MRKKIVMLSNQNVNTEIAEMRSNWWTQDLQVERKQNYS